MTKTLDQFVQVDRKRFHQLIFGLVEMESECGTKRYCTDNFDTVAFNILIDGHDLFFAKKGYFYEQEGI